MLMDEDKRLIKYFWTEEGDLRRWIKFDDKWSDICRELPYLATAITNFEYNKKVIDMIVEDFD